VSSSVLKLSQHWREIYEIRFRGWSVVVNVSMFVYTCKPYDPRQRSVVTVEFFVMLCTIIQTTVTLYCVSMDQ